MKQQNTALILEIKNPNELKEIYNDHYPWTCSFINDLVGDPFIAEDIAHTTIMKLWEKINKGHTIHNIRGFLWVTGRHRSLDYLKYMKVFRKHRKMYESHLADEKDNSILGKTEAKDLLKIIHVEIEKLPLAYKLVLISRVNGIEYQQIAKELKISVRSAKEYMYRARNILKAKLLNIGIVYS